MGSRGVMWLALWLLGTAHAQYPMSQNTPGSALQHSSLQFGKTMDSKLQNFNTVGFDDPFPSFDPYATNAGGNAGYVGGIGGSLVRNAGYPGNNAAFGSGRVPALNSYPTPVGYGTPTREAIAVPSTASPTSTDLLQAQKTEASTEKPGAADAAGIQTTPSPAPTPPNPLPASPAPSSAPSVGAATSKEGDQAQTEGVNMATSVAVPLKPLNVTTPQGLVAGGTSSGGLRNQEAAQYFNPLRNRRLDEKSFSQGNSFKDSNSQSQSYAGNTNRSFFKPRQYTSSYGTRQNGLSGSSTNQNVASGNPTGSRFSSYGGGLRPFGGESGLQRGFTSLTNANNNGRNTSPGFRTTNGWNTGGTNTALTQRSGTFKPFSFPSTSGAGSQGSNFFQPNFLWSNGGGNALPKINQNNFGSISKSSFPTYGMFSNQPPLGNVVPNTQRKIFGLHSPPSSQQPSPTAFSVGFRPNLPFSNQYPGSTFGNFGNRVSNNAQNRPFFGNSEFGRSQTQPVFTQGQYQPFPAATSNTVQNKLNAYTPFPSSGRFPSSSNSNSGQSVSQQPETATGQGLNAGGQTSARTNAERSEAPQAGSLPPERQTSAPSLIQGGASPSKEPVTVASQEAVTTAPGLVNTVPSNNAPSGQGGRNPGSGSKYSLGDIPLIVSYGLPKTPEGASGEVSVPNRRAYVDSITQSASNKEVPNPVSMKQSGSGTGVDSATSSNGMPSSGMSGYRDNARGFPSFGSQFTAPSNNDGRLQRLTNGYEATSYNSRQDLQDRDQMANGGRNSKSASKSGSKDYVVMNSSAPSSPAPSARGAPQSERGPARKRTTLQHQGSALNAREPPSYNSQAASRRGNNPSTSSSAQRDDSTSKPQGKTPNVNLQASTATARGQQTRHVSGGQNPGSSQVRPGAGSRTAGRPLDKSGQRSVRKDTDIGGSLAAAQCFRPMDRSAQYQLSNSSKGYPRSQAEAELGRRPFVRQAMGVSNNFLPSQHQLLMETWRNANMATFNKSSNSSGTLKLMSEACPAKHAPLRRFLFEGGTCWPLDSTGVSTNFTRCMQAECVGCDAPGQGVARCTEDYVWLWVWAYCPSSRPPAEVIRQVPLYLPVHCSPKVFPC